jgi:hypothetical protein
MSELCPLDPPRITDDDVAWVCDLLRLPKNAFDGPDGSDPRLEILKSNETLDIEACPGSGKTTLLVAKLAILARKWTDRRRGICVLSHTNVARREIEQRIGNTSQAKRLLSYPHFVGTIHGFVNEFLAIPWLRSKPFPIRMIDDEASQARRWWKLPPRIRVALENGGHEPTLLKIVATDFSVGDVRWGKGGTLDRTTPTYQAIQAACKASSEEGFFCYDEMFLWANELLDKIQIIPDALRARFPILFVDEVQDNSELQAALLFRLFTEGDKPVLRQRYGDANQAIYQHSGQTEGAKTDPFPDKRIRRDIPNSHRFGQEIGNLANPLALEPQGLVGCGPSRKTIASNTARKHTIFLFDDQTVGHVLTTYARYLMELFSEQELEKGIFTAVGGVHRPGQNDKLPRFVSHYWPEYDHELTAAEPKPRTFRQYVVAGRKLTRATGETHYVVEKISDGVLRMASLSNPLADLDNRKRKHRYILELLADKPKARAAYFDLVMFFGVEGGVPSTDDWANKWSVAILCLAEAIGGAQADPKTANEFLEWQIADHPDPDKTLSHQRDNLFRHPAANPKVQIRVGSIHSVKGETHTATLVMETFYYEHHLEALKPWLLGQKSGKGKEKGRNLSRLKQHYVAMTRPSHLLCLAMREDAFTSSELDQLKNTLWRVARVTAATPQWL